MPEIDGSFVFVGRADVTMLVGLDVARAEPSTFFATTCDLMRKPASASRRTYVLSAAFVIRRQSDASGAPRPSQRNQRYEYEIGPVPVQVPRVVRKTWPTRAVPEMLGSPTFVGATVGAAAVFSVAQTAKMPPTTATAAAAPTIAMYAR